MLNRVHRTVKFLANTEGRGNVKPENIDLAIHNKVLEKYEELLFDVNRLVNRQNRGLVNGALENTADKVREKIQHYLEEQEVNAANGIIGIPSEVRYFDTLLYKETYIELCKNNKQFLLSQSEANDENPIGLKTSNKIDFFTVEGTIGLLSASLKSLLSAIVFAINAISVLTTSAVF